MSRALRSSFAPLAVVVIFGMSSSALSAQTAGKSRTVTAAAFVTALYRGHFARHQRWDLTEKRERAHFSPELVALLDADAKKQAANPDEVVGLDFDPITNGQDEATGFTVGATSADGADTIVAVTVRVGSDRRTIRVRLSPAGSSWTIANLLYEEGDLVSILREAN